MKNIDPSKFDHDALMIEDPIGFNETVVSFFKKKYANHIDYIFQEIEERANSGVDPWLCIALSSVQKRIIERHLFPIFAAASSSGGSISKHHLLFCSAFIRAISLPILRIDQRIDKPPIKRIENLDNICEEKNALLGDFCLFHDGLLDITGLPKAMEIMELILSNYLQVYSSLYYEKTHRYDSDYLFFPKKKLQWIFRSRFSPLTCKYFSTTVQASILLNSTKINFDLKKFTEKFGRLRQLCDQICDVEEDIIMGNITVPVLYALLDDDNNKLAEKIRNLWVDIQSEGLSEPSIFSSQTSDIKEIILGLGGFKCSYILADKWYRGMMNLSNCNKKTNIGIEIRLLLRLKRAYLERLKLNNWEDIPNYY